MVLWKTNSSSLLHDAQAALDRARPDGRMVLFVLDEADFCCQLYTSADHAAGSGGANNRNFVDLKALIRIAIADNSRLMLVCIGNNLIFPTPDSPEEEDMDSRTNKFNEGDYLQLLREGRERGRLRPIMFERYTDPELQEIAAARLRDHVDVKSKETVLALVMLSKKACNESSSTRWKVFSCEN